MTNETFTIDGTTFTVGEKWKHCSNLDCPTEVEILGACRNWFGESVAVRMPDGLVNFYKANLLGPIPEPTIEVPVSVAKALAASTTTRKFVDALATFRRLIEEVGR